MTDTPHSCNTPKRNGGKRVGAGRKPGRGVRIRLTCKKETVERLEHFALARGIRPDKHGLALDALMESLEDYLKLSDRERMQRIARAGHRVG